MVKTDRNASSEFEELYIERTTDTPRPNSTDCIPIVRSYVIENIRFSGPSRLIFAWEKNTGERVVIKALSTYKDSRYDLSTREKRQQSQLEALHWNRKITPGIYLGLAPIDDQILDCFNQESIVLGEVIEDPTQDMLEPSLEYALLMYRIPDDQQLSTLLKLSTLRDGNISTFHRYYIGLVTQRVADMHKKLEALPVPEVDKAYWGSCEQLKEKLQHNIQLAEELMLVKNPTNVDLVESLNETLFEVLNLPSYQQYFERRRQEQRIRRCHGDLTTQNIWIVSNNASSDEEPWKYVKILDAIDFNLPYCCIDILSDFAMLVVDIQARISSESLAHDMANAIIKRYLELTQQENEISRFVLDYYLIEKALVRAVISNTYDNVPELGVAFLGIAKMRLEMLKRRLRQFYPKLHDVTSSLS